MLAFSPSQALVKGKIIVGAIALTLSCIGISQAADVQFRPDRPWTRLRHAIVSKLCGPSGPGLRIAIIPESVEPDHPMVDEVRPDDEIMGEAGDVLLNIVEGTFTDGFGPFRAGGRVAFPPEHFSHDAIPIRKRMVNLASPLVYGCVHRELRQPIEAVAELAGGAGGRIRKIRKHLCSDGINPIGWDHVSRTRNWRAGHRIETKGIADDRAAAAVVHQPRDGVGGAC